MNKIRIRCSNQVEWMLEARRKIPLLLLLLSHFSHAQLCDPTDGSPPGSPVPGILQARTLEWVAISFSNAWKWKVKVKSLSHVWLVATSWTAAHQAPPSMGFSRQEYWSGLPLPSPKDTFGVVKKSFGIYIFFNNQVIIKNDQNEIIFRSACAEEFISHFSFFEKQTKHKTKLKHIHRQINVSEARWIKSFFKKSVGTKL